jgi:hypothetical protein
MDTCPRLWADADSILPGCNGLFRPAEEEVTWARLQPRGDPLRFPEACLLDIEASKYGKLEARYVVQRMQRIESLGAPGLI